MARSSKFFALVADVEPPSISSSPRREASLNARAAKAFTFSKAVKNFAMKGASEDPGAIVWQETATRSTCAVEYDV
jgi:hypothetical protein